MLRRFLLAVLIACLAVPAAAMPLAHPVMGAPAAAAMASSAAPAEMDCHGKPAPHHQQTPAPAKHDCIGCIAPLGFVPAATAPLMLAGQPPIPALVTNAALARAGPETPPPKA